MTRNDIIVSALAQLGRGQDAQSIDTYADKLAGYANDAILDLAAVYKPVRMDSVVASDGTINLSTLPRNCVKILKITQDGKVITFNAGTGSGEVTVGVNGDVSITYQFAPILLRSTTDKPELPEYMHPLIVSYVVARERSATDASNQRGANIYYEIYEAGKRRIRPHVGEPHAYSIMNKW